MAKSRDPYAVRVAPAAARQLRKLDPPTRSRVEQALRKEAVRAATASRGGKSVKTLRGRRDRFIRLRVGDHRAMYDVLEDERVLLVLGIVPRRDLERWLRGQ
jgi:mRNA interferase RelE/StbE